MHNKKNLKVVNLGCRLNFFESDIIEKILEEKKHEKKIVVNTCAVTNNAVQKSIQEVKKLSRIFPNKEIVVTGCASQVEKHRFQGLKNVSLIVDNKNKTIPQAYEKDFRDLSQKYKFPDSSLINSTRTRAMIQIQQGCNHRCTFCIIPFGRGNSISLPIGEVSRSIAKLLSKGFKEMTLTGIDISSYGDDLPGKPKLGNLVKRIFKLHPDLKRLRLSSIDPAEVDDDLLELLKYEKRLMPHLHLSVQSGDNLILKRMKRRHNREKVIDICNEIKKVRKEMTFGADIIVGFPTESEKNFENTVDLISVCKFNNVHFFPFSPKIGTPASKMPQVRNEIIRLRIKEARNHASKVLNDLMKDRLGEKEAILFETLEKSYTNNFFKVSLGLKEEEAKKFSGSIFYVTLKAISDGKFLAEF